MDSTLWQWKLIYKFGCIPFLPEILLLFKLHFMYRITKEIFPGVNKYFWYIACKLKSMMYS